MYFKRIVRGALGKTVRVSERKSLTRANVLFFLRDARQETDNRAR